jgi:hypothetical protein
LAKEILNKFAKKEASVWKEWEGLEEV